MAMGEMLEWPILVIGPGLTPMVFGKHRDTNDRRGIVVWLHMGHYEFVATQIPEWIWKLGGLEPELRQTNPHTPTQHQRTSSPGAEAIETPQTISDPHYSQRPQTMQETLISPTISCSSERLSPHALQGPPISPTLSWHGQEETAREVLLRSNTAHSQRRFSGTDGRDPFNNEDNDRILLEDDSMSPSMPAAQSEPRSQKDSPISPTLSMHSAQEPPVDTLRRSREAEAHRRDARKRSHSPPIPNTPATSSIFTTHQPKTDTHSHHTHEVAHPLNPRPTGFLTGEKHKQTPGIPPMHDTWHGPGHVMEFFHSSRTALLPIYRAILRPRSNVIVST